MDFFKKAFLYFVGAMAVAYEEVTKAAREQQKRVVKPKTTKTVKAKA